MKKITCILGSPRNNGNTETISKRIISQVEKLLEQSESNKKVEAEIFTLNKMTYKGCQACLGCKKGSEKCVVKDDLAKVLDSAMEADILIFASPIYFGQLTAQIKAVLDRMYSFLKPTYLTEPNSSRLSAGKKFVLITSQGSPDVNDFNIFPEIKNWFTFIGYDECYVVKGCGMNDKSDAGKSTELMSEADDIAKKLI